MKRFAACLSAIVIVLSVCSWQVFAAPCSSFTLEDVGVTVSIPDDLYVFTRDVQSDDPSLAHFGFTADYLQSLFETGNIYLDAIEENATYEILVTMTSSTMDDLNQYSDSEIQYMFSSFSSTYADNGITVLNCDLYKHSQTKFMKIYISQPSNNSTAYGLQYYTVYGGKSISITLQSYGSKVSAFQETSVKAIVDSAVFDGASVQPTQAVTSAETAATTENANVTDYQGSTSDSEPYTSGTGFPYIGIVAFIIISLLVTIVVYTLPIIIYRYGIHKMPVEKGKAKKITIIYGICVFIVTCVIVYSINNGGVSVGGGIILWSFVNYKILAGGKAKLPYMPNGSPYMPNGSPYGANNAPYGANNAPYGANNAPYGANNAPYNVNSAPYGANSAPYGPNNTTYSINGVPYGTNNPNTQPGPPITQNPFTAAAVSAPKPEGAAPPAAKADDFYGQNKAEVQAPFSSVPDGNSVGTIPAPVPPAVQNGGGSSYCRKCGQKLSGDSMFCWNCGSKVEK